MHEKSYSRCDELSLRRAVEGGNVDTLNNLGAALPQQNETKEAETWLRRAVAAGNVDAMNNLAILLASQSGREIEACTYFQLAIGAGHPSAGTAFGNFVNELRRRGLDIDLITRESIRGVSAKRKKLSAALPRVERSQDSTERLRRALRRVTEDPSREVIAEAIALLGPATISHRSRDLNHDNEPQEAVFQNIKELLGYLLKEHDQQRFIYRGQTRRQQRLIIKDLSGNAFVYENIFPHDFRFVMAHHGQWKGDEEFLAVRARAARNCFDFILHVVAKCRDGFMSGQEAYSWLKPYEHEFQAVLEYIARTDVRVPHNVEFGRDFIGHRLWRLLWSLAQHYELSTALLDVTFSPAIAAWFATNEWNEKKQSPEGRGVMYRFDVLALEGLQTIYGMIEKLQSTDKDLTLRVVPFFQDLRSVPLTFAGRPLGQQGASIYGLDSVWLLEAIIASGAVETFEFNHSPEVIALGVDRSSLVPVGDPFSPIAVEF
jgi:FRG domain/Tetratricopeptide repeat